MKEIQLTQGKVALVDDVDFVELAQHKWFAHRHGRTFYAKRNMPRTDGHRQTERMHRLILERKLGRAIAPGMMPDHDDGNGLNNQRDNLSEVTGRGNGENRHHPKTSQYPGVCWNKTRGKWMAGIRVAGKNLYLGLHVTEIEAIFAREVYVSAHPELGASSIFSRLNNYGGSHHASSIRIYPEFTSSERRS